MGLKSEQKVRLDVGYIIDLVVQTPDGRRKVGIFVDGPQQFKGRWSREAKGGTLLYRRQVRAFSKLPIMSIPYWEWEVS